MRKRARTGQDHYHPRASKAAKPSMATVPENNSVNDADAVPIEPLSGEWDLQVRQVSAVLEENPDHFFGIIEWLDGDRAKLSLDVILRMCPLKLGHFCQALTVHNDCKTNLAQGSWEESVMKVKAIFISESGEVRAGPTWDAKK